MDIGDSLVHAKDSFFNNIVSEINGNNLANVLPKIEDTNQTNEAVPNLSNAEWNELKTLFTSDATTEVNEFLLNEDNASEFLEYLKTGLPQPQQSSATLPSDDIALSPEIPSKILCCYCAAPFSTFDFQYHICTYDSEADDEQTATGENAGKSKANDQNISPPQTDGAVAGSATDDAAVADKKICHDDTNNNIQLTRCLSMIAENQNRIRKLLKDCFKININQIVNLTADSGSTNDRAAPSVTTAATELDIKPDKKKMLLKTAGPHECKHCDRKFVHASGLAKHLEKHEQDRYQANGTIADQQMDTFAVVQKCTLCNRNFSTFDETVKHIECSHRRQTIDGDAEIVAANGRTFVQQDYPTLIDFYSDNLESSAEFENDSSTNNPQNDTVIIKAIILNALLQCEFCNYTFSDAKALIQHTAAHDPDDGYECTLCRINVPTLKEIVMHRQIECTYTTVDRSAYINLPRLFVCNVCTVKFESAEQLYEHRYTKLHLFPRHCMRTDRMEVACDLCGLLDETATAALEHRQQFHMRRVKRETTSSSKYRQYLCEICGKSYTQSSHLWQHLRFHRGVKPFACEEPNCNRRFTIRPDLNDHIRKCHTGERPYHCLICGKRFLTGSVFYQHRLIHRGERRYGCEECGKRFYRADALKNHQRIHTGEKPYACGQCPKNFRQRGDRDKHVRARHSTVPFMFNQNIDYNGPVRNDGRLLKKKLATMPMASSVTNSKATKEGKQNFVYVGNMACPKSMFKPQLPDIDNGAV